MGLDLYGLVKMFLRYLMNFMLRCRILISVFFKDVSIVGGSNIPKVISTSSNALLLGWCCHLLRQPRQSVRRPCCTSTPSLNALQMILSYTTRRVSFLMARKVTDVIRIPICSRTTFLLLVIWAGRLVQSLLNDPRTLQPNGLASFSFKLRRTCRVQGQRLIKRCTLVIPSRFLVCQIRSLSA